MGVVRLIGEIPHHGEGVERIVRLERAQNLCLLGRVSLGEPAADELLRQLLNRVDPVQEHSAQTWRQEDRSVHVLRSATSSAAGRSPLAGIIALTQARSA